MAILLKNDDVVVRLERAGERYTASRFDWNGLVSSARYQGTEMLGQEKPLFQRNPAKFGRGLHNEFGIKQCVGYDDCKIGEWFPKIGTGWLKKDDKPYFFYNNYDREPLTFEDSSDGDNAFVFVCDSGERNGYSYRYTKRITLMNSGFSITYTLENRGIKTIETDEYVHNFLCIDGKRMGPGYELEFPWKIEDADLIEENDPDGVLVRSGKRMFFSGATKGQFYLGGLSEGKTEKDGLGASWRLSRAGLYIAETGNFVPSGVHVWGWKHVISPEIFFSFSVGSGETISWEREYTMGRG